MTTFSYTTGNPSNLTAGSTASMNDIQGPFTDLKTFINGANITDTNVSAAGLGIAKLTPLWLYGTVNGSTGAILVAGSAGWTSSRTSAGIYVLTFSPAFSATPNLVVTPNSASAVAHTVTAISSSSATINTYLSTNGSASDSNVMFQVIGVR